MSTAPESTNHSSETADSRCAVCASALSVGTDYIVRIDIFADPAWSNPKLLESGPTIQESLTKLISEIKSMTSDELQDGVHRRFQYRICARCQPKVLANPLGLPRQSGASSN